MARCFVTRTLPGPALAPLRRQHQLEIWPEREPPPPSVLRARACDVEGLLCLLTDRIDAALIEACPRLRVISLYSVGFDNVDLGAAAARGIAVGHTPDVLTEATADLTFALLLSSARRISEGEVAVHCGKWRTWDPTGMLGQEVHGSTLGIVGMGRIGRAVAKRAQGFDMHVLASGRSGGVELNELLERSDFVSLHCPLTDATRHLVDEDALRRMKDSAILVNTARGGIVDHQALGKALGEGWIAGAALDVTEPEPLAPSDPLLDAPNLLVVPHIGSATTRTRIRMAEIAVDNLIAGLNGADLPHPVAQPSGHRLPMDGLA